MALQLDDLFGTITGAASGALAGSWANVQNFTIPELRKLAMTFVDIEQGLMANPPIYTRESARILLRMQLRAFQAIITATTALTLIELERAINAIFDAIREVVNGAVGFGLVPAPV
jgi:hypothetical protein